MKWLLIPFLAFAMPIHAKEKVVEVVRNHTRVKILESNNVGLRPGSIYDNITIFEALFDLPRPGFNYEFVDSGLGAAEPLYPMYQKGHQGSWMQLVPAFFSKKNRHIDHYTSMVTPEGCLVEGLYGLRHISEYPKHMFVKERAQGYEQIVVRLEHYTRTRPDAQCGRHMAHDPDPNFNPMAYVKKYHKAMTFKDFPQPDLDRFEWKLSAILHMSEERNKNKWPRFDLGKLKQNSLWYYPQGHSADYGIRESRPQSTGQALSLPKHLLLAADESMKQEFNLSRLMSGVEFSKILQFLSGKPKEDFDPKSEPGRDTLRLTDVTAKNVYTSGLYLERIRDVVSDVSNINNYSLVGMTVRPYESQEDSEWTGGKVIPQIRFVYQLMDPRDLQRPFEQLYLHLKFDVIDRLADKTTRDTQHLYFLKRFDEVVQAREAKDENYSLIRAQFISEFTQRPVESIAFSSSLTGIWVFGTLTRSYNLERDLQPLRIVREGVDVGYYSSTYDNDIFRRAIKVSSGAKQALLQKHMDDITPTFYRDPKRQDTSAINFGRMTCAQCHQTSGRDGVHMAFNDGLDRRFTSPVHATEYLFHEADRQLKVGQKYWTEDHP